MFWLINFNNYIFRGNKNTKQEEKMKTLIFTFILQLVLCVYLTEEVTVKFNRKTTTYIGGSSFYSSTDYFDNIGSTQNDRRQFCIKLNGICSGNTCKRCLRTLGITQLGLY